MKEPKTTTEPQTRGTNLNIPADVAELLRQLHDWTGATRTESIRRAVLAYHAQEARRYMTQVIDATRRQLIRS
jgi:hypothetical protein